MHNFKKKIKNILSDKGWTQEILADKVGITLRSLQNYLNKNSCNTDDLEKIATALGVHVGYFFEEETAPPQERGVLPTTETDVNQLLKDLESLKRELESKNELLKSKDEIISLLKSKLEK